LVAYGGEAVLGETTNLKASEGRSRYRLLAELGEGGMANVYLAVAKGPAGFNKLVVLKLLRPHLANDPDTLEMFLHEARLAARLNHPNVVQTYEVGMEAGRHGLIMEYLDGQSLAAICSRSRLVEPGVASRALGVAEGLASSDGRIAPPPPPAPSQLGPTDEGEDGRRSRFPLRMHLRVLVDTLTGLHYAHELTDYDKKRLELVHRDVSPHNVFVTYEGQVKLLDFGVAKAAVGYGERTQTGIIKGKLHYMAPEQMAGGTVDRRADIFAVGTMLWEAATGTRLWKGMPQVAIMNHVLNGQYPSPREVCADVSPALERIVMKAMAYDRERRYATALELQTDIEAELAATGDVKNRQIGAYVSDLFSEFRESTQELIDARLKMAEDAPSGEFGTLELTAIGGVPTITGSSASSQRGTAQSPVSSAAVEPPPKRTWSWWVGAGLVASVAGLLLLRSSRENRADAPIESVAPAAGPSVVPQPPVASATPGSVKIHVDSDPPGAKLFLDGNELPSDPIDTTAPRDHDWHTIRGEARGRVPKEVHVSFDSDVWITLKLDPVPAPVTVRNGPPAAVSQRTATTPIPPASTVVSCVPPYYVEDGIKKVKPGCM
jgi:serine/threonine-protein kinase